MRHDLQKSLLPFPRILGWAAVLLFALSGCGLATKDAVDAVVDDSAGSPKADVVVQGGPADATTSRPDARVTDARTSQADALARDAKLDRADAIAPDAGRISDDADGVETIPVGNGDASPEKDASPEVVPGRSDLVAVDNAPPRADATVLGDASSRADAGPPDTLGEDPDAEALPCKATGGSVSLGHLTPPELKTILDGSEDPYLINVKGTSIPNIPGTDAVLVDDIDGIEALVGGNLCADIILYCRSGNTSQTVGAQLIAKGYLQVRDLEGGITAWTAAGYPTE